MSGEPMSVTDGLIEEELRTMVAGGATARADDELIAEARRRALDRAGLMVANTPSDEAVGHWEAVLDEIRREEGRTGDGAGPTP